MQLKRSSLSCSCQVLLLLLLSSNDRFDLIAFEQSDEAVATIPNTVSRAPNFISLDLAAAGQNDHGFAALSLRDTGAAGRHRIERRASV